MSALLQDIITGDEIISDSYDLKEVDGVVYEVDCAMITLGAVEVSAYTPLLEALNTILIQYRYRSQRIC
jgi:hypothetical protein